jgi:branched-chain amino acid aminotransferase
LAVPDGAAGFADLYTGLPLGVYTALRTFDHNKFLCLQEHIERTKRSMALLGWDYQLDEPLLRRALHEICSTSPFPEMRVRLDVLAEPAAALGVDSRLLVAVMLFTPPDPALYERGVAVGIARELSRQNPLVKAADFAVRRRRYPVGQTAVYEHLLMDEDGRLLEGTSSNFYAVKDGRVYTAGEGVLEGVTRRIVLELLPALDIPVTMQGVTLAEVAALDEAFLSGSSRAILPVVDIDGHPIGSGRPGAIGRRLLLAYNEFVARSIKTAVSELQ